MPDPARQTERKERMPLGAGAEQTGHMKKWEFPTGRTGRACNLAGRSLHVVLFWAKNPKINRRTWRFV